MGAAGKFSPNRSPSSEQKPRGLLSDMPAETENETRASVSKAWSKLLEIIPLGILLSFLAAGIWLGIGFVLGKLSPQRTVTVQQFEISSDIANRVSVSGKTASDIVVDIFNDASTHATKYGTDYFRYDGSHGSQPLALLEPPQAQLPASYGIVISGISLDSLVQLYDRQRYEQWTIDGDIISSAKGLLARIRLNQGGIANAWETPPSTVATPADLIREATAMMLASVDPELLGRSYLQQRKFPEAKNVFRQWEMASPLQWKPTYYLSLAYDSQEQEEEANNLADWSRKIEYLGNQNGFVAPRTAPSERAPASDLARTTRLALKTVGTSNAVPASPSEQRKELDILQGAELEATAFSDNNPKNADYLIQLARILDREARIESSLNRLSLRAPQCSEEAILKLSEAIKLVPGNAGLYDQRAILYEDLAAIMKNRDERSPEVRMKEELELKDYTQALEMQPSEGGPLWGAVYALLDLHRSEEAVVLARTITLLEPGWIDAEMVYLVAIEGTQSEGRAGDAENEVEARLRTLLQCKLNDSQMQTLYYAFQKNHNRKGMDLVAAEGRRRFPSDPTFQRQKRPANLQTPAGAALSKPRHS